MGAPQSVDDAAKRERILRAALEVCRLHGMEAARMEEVARRAGVSKGTLYRFFESKEDLLLATVIASYEEGLQIVDSGVASARDPAARLDAYLEGLIQVLCAVGPRMSVHYQAWGVVARAPDYEARLNGFLRDFHARRDAELEALIRDGQRTGVFRRDVDVAALTAGASMLLSGFLYRTTFDPEGAGAESLRRCLRAMLRDALLPEPGERAADA
jgi:AcrR family transcriptional regulator